VLSGRGCSLPGISSGRIFRAINRHGNIRESLADQSGTLLVKRYAAPAGLDSTVFSGYSLRAGLATSAAFAGAGQRQIMKQIRHKSEATVRRYIRDHNLFRENVSGLVGL
jgi:integrase